jgi:hypothetical protein
LRAMMARDLGPGISVRSSTVPPIPKHLHAGEYEATTLSATARFAAAAPPQHGDPPQPGVQARGGAESII